MDPAVAPYEGLSDAKLDDFVARVSSEFHAPGMAVLVVEGDRTYAKGYGVSDLAQATPMVPETMFFAASTTKSFTSAMAAHLVESSDYPSISWQTPLADILRDDFVLDQTSPIGQWATTHATIEDALSHRSGIPRHDLSWTNGHRTNQEIVRSLRHLPMHTEPRTKWEYSNNPYTAVSTAIEKVLGRSLKDLLQKHIFDPLKMHMTTYDLADAQEIVKQLGIINISRGYLWNSDDESYDIVPWTDLPPPRGAGGIISNVVDYQHWVRHLMKPTNLTLALSENAVKAMRTPQMLVTDDLGRPSTGPKAYGLGLFSLVYRGREILLHSGAINGYMTTMLMVPPTPAEIKAGKASSGWAVVVMQNSFSLALDMVAWYLLDQYLGTPKDECFDSAQQFRDQQAKAEEAIQFDAVVKRLYGNSVNSQMKPALPISDHQGIYQHPGYGQFEITLASTRDPSGRSMDATGTEPRLLYMKPAKPSYMAISYTLHHVSGEWWWARKRIGPGDWLTSTAHKINFVIGIDGKVSGVNFQAESAMPDFSAFFEKI